MKKNPSILPFVLVLLVFIVFRAINAYLNAGINVVELKTLGIASAAFPFGIIKETMFHDSCFPFYYFIIYLFKLIFNSEIILRIVNAIISLFTIVSVFILGKKIKDNALGVFLALLFSINHFFFFYSNQIAPYCIMFLFGAILLNSLYDYIKEPASQNLKKLMIANLFFLLSDKTAFIYVISEIIILKGLKSKKFNFSKSTKPIFTILFTGFLLTLLYLLAQFIVGLKVMMPDISSKIAFNFSGLYLLLNEYISPYLSFETFHNIQQSTLGMLYSFFLNPDFHNINSLKLFITLLYSSFLPLMIGIILSIKTCLKNFKLNALMRIAVLNLIFVSVFSFFQLCDLKPIYVSQFFITFLVVFGVSLYSIKDKFVKYLFIVSFVLIQLITPKVNSFNIAIDKKAPTINVFKEFLNEYKTAENALFIFPEEGHYASLHFKKLNAVDLDLDSLFLNSPQSFLEEISKKYDKKLSKENLLPLCQIFLSDTRINTYIYNLLNKLVFNTDYKTVIVFVDKLNSRPISYESIERCTKITPFKNDLPVLSFQNPQKSYNSLNKLLVNSVKSKNLYDLMKLLDSEYYVHYFVQYKKTPNGYEKVQSSTYDIYYELNSYASDYMFVVFGKMPE